MNFLEKIRAIWLLFKQLDETRLERLSELDSERSRIYREHYEAYLNKTMKVEEGERIDREYQALIVHIDNESESLLQQSLLDQALRAGVIPDAELYKNAESPLRYKVLSEAGIVALRKKIRQHRRDVVKDWVGIVMPVISGIIAILGLLVALQRK